MIHRKLLALLAASLLFTGLPTQASESNPRPVHVFAAASLKGALDQVVHRWKTIQGSAVIVTYAGSNALAQQIQHGAPADLYISASVQWMDALASKALLRSGTRRNLFGNRLVLIAPNASGLDLSLDSLTDLAPHLGKSGRISISHRAVPAGAYAEQALDTLGLWESIANRTAPAGNVRAALLRVARGETPLGVVYQTDARAESRVRVLDRFPENSHVAIHYPAAVLASSTHDRAEDFLRFLLSDKARTIFSQSGFVLEDR